MQIDHRSIILTLQDLTECRWPKAMAEADLNSVMLHAVRLPEDIHHLVIHRQSDSGRAFREECLTLGIRIEYQMHTASWLLPRARFLEAPDLFRMDRAGRRTPDCSLFEEKMKDLAGRNGMIRLIMRPVEIKTLKIDLRGKRDA